MRLHFLFCIGFLLLTSACGAAAEVSLPPPSHYIEDYSNVIEQDYERSLNGILQELEQKTGAQVIVLTILTTEGIPIEQYAIELVEKWQLGQKGKDNGLLFMLATQDRRYRFEIGYGLEHYITDQYCGRLGREVLVPYLKKGQFGQGIYETTLRIAQRIASESGAQLSGMPKLQQQAPQQRRSTRTPCCGVFFPFLLFFLIIATRGRILFWMLPFMFLGNRGMFSSGGSFGGGSFGGGFGSFGGGGGGGFGGGGASGSW